MAFSKYNKIIFKIIFVLIFPLAGPFAYTGIYLLLSAWAITGPRRSIEALTLSWLVSFLNPGIYSLSPHSDFFRWVVIGTAFISVSTTMVVRRIKVPRTVYWLFAFITIAGLLSLTASYAPDVSLFKLFSFGIAVFTILIAYHLTQEDIYYWQQWFLFLFGIIVIIGFPLIFFDVGYTRNQRGFQGLLNHPQAYAVFIAPLLAWLMGMIFEKRVSRYTGLLLSATAAISLFLTQSRTGMLAAIGGIITAFVLNTFRDPKVIRQQKQWMFWIIPIFSLGAILGVLNSDVVIRSTTEFILKGQEGHAVGEAFQASRGELLSKSWVNFQDNKLTGIGFGVASDPSDFNIRRDPLFGLPVSASLEKGFAVVAALEEVGLIGFTILIFLVSSLLGPALSKQGGIATAALAIGALLVNFGESIFFSLGGIGLLVWLLFGLAQATGKEAYK